MKRELITTSDGSKTLLINGLEETYHSKHGALQEAIHVFIKNGLNLINSYEINILELGFGTGLNVLVTIDEYLKNDKNHKIKYFSIEKYPIFFEEASELSYSKLFSNDFVKDLSLKIHELDWEASNELTKDFHLTKIKKDFFDLKNTELPPIDLVYFDCFGARVQPDLWEMELLEIVASKIRAGGLLTTYASKGSVRRNLIELGFEVEKKQGPPGKREMMIAWKK
ncbi:tRNA (5-methylaminomethyl-2-thiouridine)(34)-methyltransferase MnmD [Epilithonimonas ginsengisoli]|uniref:tRNA (5-methylaminomethyl-2-thiouridine)(34)-methyltransferase MnmD n=1 Tax=Epilithonimonas ginsengisoli TaxID=1245592 RepID=A0ABU4JDR2_9FLAO|nr:MULTISPECIES: tRNA (5-methylaminomethyl-2-thiouridine)(34)-methyltransferase MnmD [Chryseobacterium group]MBV6878958.1 tRNA (5-methylaminomethyl-2-thiouridine)(34)-methyltransferase MnmD [Epilithonimonas sp. FP105]MDW8547805.1 tRNA (5-methylaminomethyl-2-thiouridine)(34)-methyltransferase MnmD [Epilithonimonas ginsengisoli]OAH76032.1 peptidase [Chryseobacterium sp. FP211-J200]